MKLQDIRNAKTFNELKPAIAYLCDNMQKMTWGEYQAYRRTLQDKAHNLGVDNETLNKHATDFQHFGYFNENDIPF